MPLRAGAARLDITPKAACFLAGYEARSKPHEGVHIPLSLRALYVHGEKDAEAVVISADILWWSAKAAGEARAAIRSELGIPEESCLLAGTHTHSAPDDRNAEYLGSLAGHALAAAALAKDRARPVKLSLARGKSNIGVNRREKRADGTVCLGHNPKGPADREIIVLSVDSLSGKPVARAANFACHGVVLGGDSYVLSGDWPGMAARVIEAHTGGAPFLFLNGGAGNVNPKVGPQSDLVPVAEIADEFFGDYVAALKNLESLWGGLARVMGAELPIALPAKEGNKAVSVPLHGLRIGGLKILGYPGEMFSETAMAVKKAEAGPAMVCGYVDAGDFGYVPTREAYRDGGYEVDVTPFAETAEEILRKGLIELAGELD